MSGYFLTSGMDVRAVVQSIYARILWRVDETIRKGLTSPTRTHSRDIANDACLDGGDIKVVGSNDDGGWDSLAAEVP